MSPLSSIIILTYNNLSYTRQCLRSILRKTPAGSFEVIVVDNGSTDGTRPYLERLAAQEPAVRLRLNETNAGFAAGNNQGAGLARGDVLVFLNNDTIVTEGWLDGLRRHLQDPAVGMVGPVTNSAANEAAILAQYKTDAEMEAFARQRAGQLRGQAFDIPMLAFFCVAIRREVWEQVGGLDERFGLGMFEDDDYALRVRQAGYTIRCAEDVYVHHYGSASFSRLKFHDYQNLFRQNLRLFEAKWGIRWHPQAARGEKLYEQLRQNLDTSLWLSDLVQERDLALQQIQGSQTWQQFELFRKVRLRLAPSGSRRERLLGGGLRLALGPARAANRARRGVVDRLFGARMSWSAYRMENYWRARHARCPRDLSGLRGPSETGLVSIVLPVYNGEDYLEEALDSVLAQTYERWELIVVDDGSTDDTPRILAQYAAREPRLRVIRQANQRLPRALNAGFAQARGQYLTWTSADNRLKPEFLAEMVACLERHPDWDIIYANLDIIDQAGNPLRGSDWYLHYQNPPGSEHIFLPANPAELNTVANNYFGAAFLYRDRVARLLGGYSPHRFGMEDYDYWMRANAFLTLRHADFDRPVYEYRFHNRSLTAQDAELGITRRREGMMVFDTFRLDFANTPAVWQVDDDGAPAAQAAAAGLREQIRRAGHLLVEDIPTQPGAPVQRAWLPALQVWLTAGGANGSPPARLAKDVPVTRAWVPCPGGAQEPGAGWDWVVRLDGGATVGSGWRVDNAGALFTALDVLCKSQRLAEIEALAENPPPAELAASVVVCTFRRGERVREVLEALARQDFTAGPYEVVVVNNDPADQRVAGLVQDVQQRCFPNRPEALRLVTCPLPGLSYARNAGIGEARGEIVCFVDDDAVPEPDWLAQTWAAFQALPEAGVIGGQILLDVPPEKRAVVRPGWEKFWSHLELKGDAPYSVENWWEFPWGANWCARRTALVRIGGFRGQYGRKGKDFGGGEEVAAASLIQRLGYTIGLAPSSIVHHRVDPERFSMRHVRSTIRAGQNSLYNLVLEQYLPVGLSLQERVRQLVRQVRGGLLAWGLPWSSRLETWWTVRAGLRLLGTYWQDRNRRHQPPYIDRPR